MSSNNTEFTITSLNKTLTLNGQNNEEVINKNIEKEDTIKRVCKTPEKLIKEIKEKIKKRGFTNSSIGEFSFFKNVPTGNFDKDFLARLKNLNNEDFIPIINNTEDYYINYIESLGTNFESKLSFTFLSNDEITNDYNERKNKKIRNEPSIKSEVKESFEKTNNKQIKMTRVLNKAKAKSIMPIKNKTLNNNNLSLNISNNNKSINLKVNTSMNLNINTSSPPKYVLRLYTPAKKVLNN
jgi:hypothetical protein